MSAADDFRETLEETFEDVEFPVSSLMSLIPALPKGPMTKFDLGDETVSAMELGSALGAYADFPYESMDAMLDDMVEAMQEEGYFDA